MKTILIILTASILSLGFSISASAGPPDSVEQKKCLAQLHKCFLTGHIEEALAILPVFPGDCGYVCDASRREMTPACDFDLCVSTCRIVFEIGGATICPNPARGPMAESSESSFLDQLLAQNRPQSDYHVLLTARQEVDDSDSKDDIKDDSDDD